MEERVTWHYFWQKKGLKPKEKYKMLLMRCKIYPSTSANKRTRKSKLPTRLGIVTSKWSWISSKRYLMHKWPKISHWNKEILNLVLKFQFEPFQIAPSTMMHVFPIFSMRYRPTSLGQIGAIAVHKILFS